MGSRPWLKNAVDLHILGSKRLVLCEGVNDEQFIPTVARFFKKVQDFQLIQFFPCAGRIHNVKMAIQVVKELQPHSPVFMIINQDFHDDEALEKKKKKLKGTTENMEVLSWDFPSIESYLFIHEVMKNQTLLKKLLDEHVQEALFTKYMESYFAQNADIVRKPWQAHQKWTRAMELANRQEEKTLEEVYQIAQVISGHVWVEKMGTKTKDLIDAIQPSITEHCPSISIILSNITAGIK